MQGIYAYASGCDVVSVDGAVNMMYLWVLKADLHNLHNLHNLIIFNSYRYHGIDFENPQDAQIDL
jgi:hypothetical protein